MSAIYLITSVILVFIFVRNYDGVRRKVSARLFVIVFFFAFIFSVIYPEQITKIANFFGVGRGSDFMFYNFIVFGLGMLALLYRKIVHLERRLVELNRQASINLAVLKQEKE